MSRMKEGLSQEPPPAYVLCHRAWREYLTRVNSCLGSSVSLQQQLQRELGLENHPPPVPGCVHWEHSAEVSKGTSVVRKQMADVTQRDGRARPHLSEHLTNVPCGSYVVKQDVPVQEYLISQKSVIFTSAIVSFPVTSFLLKCHICSLGNNSHEGIQQALYYLRSYHELSWAC